MACQYVFVFASSVWNPALKLCEPVTYETDADSVNNFEKWSAGLFHAFVIKPVEESTNV